MSDPKQTVEFLKNVPLFSGLSSRQLKKLANAVVPRSFSAGDEMVKQGEKGVGIFIIISGQADAILEMDGGEKKTVNSFDSTDFFGELALLTEGPRTASVLAKTDVECVVLARWNFIPLLKEDAEMGVAVAQELASRFRTTLDAISS